MQHSVDPNTFNEWANRVARTAKQLCNDSGCKRIELTDGFLVSVDKALIKYFSDILEDLWKNGLEAVHRIKDIEEGRETDDELADAKHYVDKVLDEVTKMKSGAMIQQNISS